MLDVESKLNHDSKLFLLLFYWNNSLSMNVIYYTRLAFNEGKWGEEEEDEALWEIQCRYPSWDKWRSLKMYLWAEELLKLIRYFTISDERCSCFAFPGKIVFQSTSIYCTPRSFVRLHPHEKSAMIFVQWFIAQSHLEINWMLVTLCYVKLMSACFIRLTFKLHLIDLRRLHRIFDCRWMTENAKNSFEMDGSWVIFSLISSKSFNG